MSINVDARGLGCPQPVIATKKALESIASGVITTIVDNATAKENVAKLAAASNCGVSITETNGHFYIKITKGDTPTETSLADEDTSSSVGEGVVYLITQDTMGHGSKELGAVLMKSLMYTILESSPQPKAIMFVNSAVQLTIADSPVLEHLKQLAERGVEVLSCGTCLDYYNLKDKLAVGGVTDMFTIVETMAAAPKAVTI